MKLEQSLFNLGNGAESFPEKTARTRRKSAYENPNHVQPELMSQGISNHLVKIDFFRLFNRKYLSDATYRLEQMMDKMDERMFSDETDDVLFVDHRTFGCLLPPRRQRRCGSCCAFAMTTLAEFLRCKKTGELLAFSEQYMVDCGHYNKLEACNGGNPVSAIEFIHNFGVELLSDYPYEHKVNQCPYEESDDIKTTGYIRMDLANATWRQNRRVH